MTRFDKQTIRTKYFFTLSHRVMVQNGKKRNDFCKEIHAEIFFFFFSSV